MKSKNIFQHIVVIMYTLLVFLPCNIAFADSFFSDDFESGDLMHPTTTDGSTWSDGNVSDGCSVSVSNAIKHSGNYSLKFQWRDGWRTGGGAEQKFRLEHYEDFSFKLNKEIRFTKSC